MSLLTQFIILNISNVIIQTVKSLCTIKGNKYVAAVANAIAFGLYTIVVVYMMCDLPLGLKALVVALCNLIGVFIVKLVEEKRRKDKLWKIEATVTKSETEGWEVCYRLLKERIPTNYIDIDKYIIFNCYCATQKDTLTAKKILDLYDAKYFASEAKEI